MDYVKHYDTLIQRAKSRVRPEGYVEKHHIVPVCLGGSNAKDNLVFLTAEEHYIAHQLLVKIHPEHGGLIYAAIMMATCSDRHQRSGNKMYAWLRKRYSDYMKTVERKPMTVEQRKYLSEIRKTITGWKHSEETKRKIGDAQRGEKNHMHGTRKTEEEKAHLSAKLKGKPKSEETRRRMSESLKGNKRSSGKKKPHSEETKMKIRLAQQAYQEVRRNAHLDI